MQEEFGEMEASIVARHQEGDTMRDEQFWALRLAGLEIVSARGRYCRALCGGRDVVLRWNGEEWVQV